MSELPLHSVALYNPHLLSADELVDLFAVRQGLLNRLLADLPLEDDGVPQSHLIIGQRGMGKTMLLRRLAYAIERDDARRARWIPLTFPEEQYDVGQLSGFWLNCIDALGDALERSGLPQEAQKLDRALSELPKGEDARCTAALDLLVATARGCGRRLVLLVDNVDLIFERIKDQQWLLRETLATTPELVLIGASAQALEASFRYDQSFYEFLRIHELAGLDLEETRTLLLHYADRLGAEAVRGVVEGEPSRIKALHTLTAGNPRTIVLLFQLLDQGAEGNVRTDLERLLDHCTPLYKARLEALPAQAQRVVHGLAIHWHPATAGMMAEELGLGVNAVSSQLNRLVKQGVVQKEAFDPPSKIGFRLAERFFNIWYLMRTSRRVRRKLIWLVEFLRIMYRPEEIRAKALRHLEGSREQAKSTDSLFRAEYSFALSQAVDDQGLRDALETSGVESILANRRYRLAIHELIDLETVKPLKDKVTRMQLLREAQKKVLLAPVDRDGWDPQRFWSLLGGSASLAPHEKLELASRLGADPNVIGALEEILGAESSKWGSMFGPEMTSALQGDFRRGFMESMNDLAGARSAGQLLACPELELVAAVARLEKGFDREAAHVLEMRISALKPRNLYAWLGLGNLLQVHLGRYAESESAYRRAIDLDCEDHRAWFGLGVLLQRHLHRHKESESAYREAILLNKDSGFLWAALGSLLQMHADRYEEAVSSFRKAIELAPQDGRIHSGLAWLFFERGENLGEAEEVARKAIELAPNDLDAAHTAAAIFARGGQWVEARGLALRFLREGDEASLTRTFDDTVLFFREAVTAGHAEDAVALLDEAGLGEKWLPLRAALATVGEGRRAYLRRLAPEVRQPAQELLVKLVGEAWDGGPA